MNSNLETKKMIEMRKDVEPGETPESISISMIDQDLKNGVSKSDMAIKYNIKPWEVDRMFEHPLLKGRRPSKKRPLSFTFVDDMSEQTFEAAQEALDPNQVTIEDVIAEANEEVKANWDEHTRVEEGMDHKGEDDELEIPTLGDTLDLVKEQELEMEEDSFEL